MSRVPALSTEKSSRCVASTRPSPPNGASPHVSALGYRHGLTPIRGPLRARRFLVFGKERNRLSRLKCAGPLRSAEVILHREQLDLVLAAWTQDIDQPGEIFILKPRRTRRPLFARDGSTRHRDRTTKAPKGGVRIPRRSSRAKERRATPTRAYRASAGMPLPLEAHLFGQKDAGRELGLGDCIGLSIVRRDAHLGPLA